MSGTHVATPDFIDKITNLAQHIAVLSNFDYKGEETYFLGAGDPKYRLAWQQSEWFETLNDASKGTEEGPPWEVSGTRPPFITNPENAAILPEMGGRLTTEQVAQLDNESIVSTIAGKQYTLRDMFTEDGYWTPQAHSLFEKINKEGHGGFKGFLDLLFPIAPRVGQAATRIQTQLLETSPYITNETVQPVVDRMQADLQNLLRMERKNGEVVVVWNRSGAMLARGGDAFLLVPRAVPRLDYFEGRRVATSGFARTAADKGMPAELEKLFEAYADILKLNEENHFIKYEDGKAYFNIEAMTLLLGAPPASEQPQP